MMLPAARESGKIFIKKTVSFLAPERKYAKISSKFYVSAQMFQNR